MWETDSYKRRDSYKKHDSYSFVKSRWLHLYIQHVSWSKNVVMPPPHLYLDTCSHIQAWWNVHPYAASTCIYVYTCHTFMCRYFRIQTYISIHASTVAYVYTYSYMHTLAYKCWLPRWCPGRRRRKFFLYKANFHNANFNCPFYTPILDFHYFFFRHML